MKKQQPKSEIARACLFALMHNLGLMPHEKVLIVTDREKRFIAEAMKEAALFLTPRVDLLEIPVLEVSGREPPDSVAEVMLRSDVILMPLAKSLSWTQARMKATVSGARIASMPGITAETVLRTFTQDYEPIRRRVNLLCDLLDEADGVGITSDLGTDLTFRVKGRRGRGRRAGIYTEKGSWGNLPCGEAFIAPIEGTANGVYFVDASHSGTGKIREPIRVEVREGRAQKLTGGEQSETLTSVLRSLDNPDAFNIAEFG
ncbi:MAG: aminopeptidase, partial [Candidatus Aminicenantes bacterium]|nr:aminopeptidase [Candidatus Aminicenantes bacterium]